MMRPRTATPSVELGIVSLPCVEHGSMEGIKVTHSSMNSQGVPAQTSPYAGPSAPSTMAEASERIEQLKQQKGGRP